MDEKYVKVDDIVEYCTTYSACLQNKGQSVTQAALRRVKEFAKENAADVLTVKHGRWIKCDYKRLDDAGEVQTYIGQGVCCSKCRTGFHKNEVKNWIGCPCCLTRMDGDAE